MGAIGGYVGGMLTKAGVDVTFVEPWQAHIDAVRAQDGLLVKDAKAGEFLVDVKVLAISDLATNTELFDYCIIAMKSYDTEWAAKLMEQHVKPDSGAFISIQNGINDYRLAATVTGGAARCIGCVTTIGNGCLTPGEVIRWDRQSHCFKFGEHDGSITPRIRELKQLFDLGVTGGADVTENLWGARWSKLATNCFINVTAGLSGLKTMEVRTLPSAIPLATAMAAEACQVAQAMGVSIEPVMGLRPVRMRPLNHLVCTLRL
jgi:2-dehydropantoate 2-reductase